jgi:hypothetical protein
MSTSIPRCGRRPSSGKRRRGGGSFAAGLGRPRSLGMPDEFQLRAASSLLGASRPSELGGRRALDGGALDGAWVGGILVELAVPRELIGGGPLPVVQGGSALVPSPTASPSSADSCMRVEGLEFPAEGEPSIDRGAKPLLRNHSNQ